MKVLHFGKFYPPCFGGIERVMQEIVEGLNDQNIQADVLCAHSILRDTQEEHRTFHGQPYRVYRCASFGKFASTAIAPSMFFKFQHLHTHYDIIHIHHPDPLSAFVLYLSRPKSKIVLHWHSDIIHQKHLLKLYHPFLLWLIKRSDVIIGATPSHIQDSDYTAFFKNKTILIPYAVSPIKRNDDERYLDKNFFNIFSLGRLVYYKGYEYLIEAAKHLDDSFKIYIGGDGVLKDKLHHQIKQHQLEHKVILLGAIPHEKLYGYYQDCDVFTLPSIYRSEMFGIVQVEAMLFGKPVVSTSIQRSGVSYVNQHHHSGLIVPPQDPLALAQAFIQLKNDTPLYEKLTQGAKQRANDFSAEKIIPEFEKLYRSLFD